MSWFLLVRAGRCRSVGGCSPVRPSATHSPFLLPNRTSRSTRRTCAAARLSAAGAQHTLHLLVLLSFICYPPPLPTLHNRSYQKDVFTSVGWIPPAKQMGCLDEARSWRSVSDCRDVCPSLLPPFTRRRCTASPGRRLSSRWRPPCPDTGSPCSPSTRSAASLSRCVRLHQSLTARPLRLHTHPHAPLPAHTCVQLGGFFMMTLFSAHAGGRWRERLAAQTCSLPPPAVAVLSGDYDNLRLHNTPAFVTLCACADARGEEGCCRAVSLPHPGRSPYRPHP